MSFPPKKRNCNQKNGFRLKKIFCIFFFSIFCPYFHVLKNKAFQFSLFGNFVSKIAPIFKLTPQKIMFSLSLSLFSGIIMRMHGLGLVMLLMCYALLVETQDWWSFKNKHINDKITKASCTSEIAKRRITAKNDSKKCKEKNTFIKATSNQVRAVCQNGGKPDGKNYVSLYRFTLVTCKLLSGERQPHCKYRGNKSFRHIIVACNKNKYPVHYAGDIIYVLNSINESVQSS